jgi:hypothetical protein
VSASCVTISNLDLLSNRETRVKPGKRTRKNTNLNEFDVRKPLAVSISRSIEELRLLCGLEFDNYQTRLKSRIFICIPWLNSSFFGGAIFMVLWKGESRRI